MTGSETGSIFIYDVMNSPKYKEIMESYHAKNN